MDVQMTRPGISESGSLLPGEVGAEVTAINSATSGSLDLDGALGSDAALAGDQTREIGGLDAEESGELLLLAARQTIGVSGEVHAHLPAGTFTTQFTSQNQQVKVISREENAGFNSGMDVSEIRKIRLRQLIDERFDGIDSAFALAIERSASYVSRVFSENRHSRGVGEKLARHVEQALELEPGYLDRPLSATEQAAVKPKEASYNLEPVGVWDDETPLDDGEVELPFLKEVELSAGSGRTAIHEAGSRKMRFGARTMRARGVEPANAVCVTVTGNSMEPVLRDGATVSIDRGTTRIHDGDMYAIDHDGQLRVKQLYRLPGGGIRLRSFNRDEHPDEEYSLEQIERHKIRVLGRVWWGAMFF